MGGSDIIEQGAAAALWQALVREGEREAGCALGEDVESYLVFALMRHLRDEQMVARVMALDWLQAHELPGRGRVDALRDVGDRCLIVAGLFPGQARRRRVDAAYFVDLGRSAYETVAGATRAGYADLFAQLVDAYLAMVRVLASAAWRPLPRLVGDGTMSAQPIPAGPARPLH